MNIVPSKENITNQLNHVVNIPVVLSTGDEIRSTNLVSFFILFKNFFSEIDKIVYKN